MATFACPRCGSPVSFNRSFNLGRKPFCSRCGWNLARAEAALAAKSTLVTFFPLAIAALVFFIILANVRSSNTPAIYFVPVVFLTIGLIPMVGYYSTKKALAAAKLTVNPDLALAEAPLDSTLQQLQSLPRPRRIKFRLGGNLASVMVVFGALAALNAILLMAAGRASRRGHGDSFAPFLPLLFVLLVFAAVVVIPFFRDRRNLPLLRDGELALARVVSQRTVQQGKSSYSSIDYQFKTNSGLEIRATARDLTNSVFEDMTIAVFYDPVHPDKNITPCATYLKVSPDPL